MQNADFVLDIEVYANHGAGYWAQARYLVHGYDDVLWTDSIDEACAFMAQSLVDMREKEAVGD